MRRACRAPPPAAASCCCRSRRGSGAPPPAAFSSSRGHRLSDAPLSLAWRDAPPPEWDRWLAGAHGASFSVRDGWIAALACLSPAPRPHVLEARRDGRLVAALVLCVNARFGRRWVHSMPFGAYGGVLVAAGEPDLPAIEATLAAECTRWAGAQGAAGGEVTTPPMAADEPPSPAWLAHGARPIAGVAHRIDLAPGIAALESGLRRETKKGFRHAARAGVTVTSAPEALAEVYALYHEQARRWRLRRPYPEAFLRALLEHPSGFAELWVARAGGRVHAGILALRGFGETFLWWSGADPASRSSLAYPYLIWHVARASAERGERWVNVGASGGRSALHRFKESLGATPARYWSYALPAAAGDWIGRALGFARRVRRRP